MSGQDIAVRDLVRWAVLCRDERDAAVARMLVERSKRLVAEDRAPPVFPSSATR